MGGDPFGFDPDFTKYTSMMAAVFHRLYFRTTVHGIHNVPEERLFRPSAWSRFGALDPQAADYRACATYGPLYR